MEALTELLEEALGSPIEVCASDSVRGGCIHSAQRVTTNHGPFFVKQAPVGGNAMLAVESLALQEMARTRTVRVPTVVAEGVRGLSYYLVLEWMDLHPMDELCGAKLGTALAALHEQTADSQYGWDRDNFIGSTPQANGWLPSWPEFFRDRRLRPQLSLARTNGYTLPSPETFLDGIHSFFEGDDLPSPRPLHGDLWGGNAACDGMGEPVLFDPAFYYGDPETDIAFSRYFGGFPKTFYRSYAEILPERPGWKIRQTLYNLYHVLNHLNLFGSGYHSTASRMISELNDAIVKGRGRK